MANQQPSTLGALRASGYQVLPVREEIRKNLVAKLSAGERLFPGIMGYEETVVPQLENAILSGHDIILLGERGAMTAGSYFWRPGMVEHGPMFSRDGGLFFFRTKGGSLSTRWVDVPGGEKLVDDYVAQRPFFAGPTG